MLERGADPNLWTHGSGSPLSAALQGNALDVAALWVERGARVESSPIQLTNSVTGSNTLGWVPTGGAVPVLPRGLL